MPPHSVPRSVLDVKVMLESSLTNYDKWVYHFMDVLETIHCALVYDGPSVFRDHIQDKMTYACSVQYRHHKKNKIFKSVFPIMLGSRLDFCVRKLGYREFTVPLLVQVQPYDAPFECPDIAATFFLIRGLVRQLPNLFTNDPTNTFVMKNGVVRCYAYDADDRGKELGLYVNSTHQQKEGDLIVAHNDGSKTQCVDQFFDHCPYPIDQAVYMNQVYKGSFDIDHLSNKMVISPGHLYVRLFMKYLYRPIREAQWNLVRSKLTMVIKSINTGTLLHVLSRKTLYFKESGSTPKMVQSPKENHREIGTNGEVYVEKCTGCYREVNMQTYPLNPYLTTLTIRQISSKVKSGTTKAYYDSYTGFFSPLGVLENKNVGRTHMLVRHTAISMCDDTKPVLDYLQLEPGSSAYYVVVNEACIPVTVRCYRSINLRQLKQRFEHIECYEDAPFLYIRYKVGLLFRKMLEITPTVWVTPRDEAYWARECYGFTTKEQIVKKFDYEYLMGYLVDLNPFFPHNFFSKNLLAFNALKNSVLAIDERYARYFMESLSTYMSVTELHQPLCLPVDEFSAHFVIYMPQITVIYACFKGNNQEDCIIMRDDLDVFDCFQFYSVRVVFNPPHPAVQFFPVTGDPDPQDNGFLGTIVYPGEGTIESQSTHIKVQKMGRREYHLFFSKCYCKILQYDLTPDRLTVCLDRFHASSTGDKVSSLHGQKAVILKSKEMPMVNGVRPDAIVNPYCLNRMTLGQFMEGLVWGDGHDVYVHIQNSDGIIIKGARVFVSKVFYFQVAYLAHDHLYAPMHCTRDKIHGQTLKGRSRGGGMRLGKSILNILIYFLRKFIRVTIPVY